jgi:hypothetical protein
MGAWGPGVFSNDAACDARDEWRGLLVDGVDPAEASCRLVSRFGSSLEEVEFWTGLAAAQHETGHLQDDVRDRALALIESGEGLEEWDGAARARALSRLADKLRGPQPKPKKLRGPRPSPDPGVEVGDVLRVWSEDRARWSLFAVIDVLTDSRARRRDPVLVGLYTPEDATEPPPAEDLAGLPYLSAVGDLAQWDELPDDHPFDAPEMLICMVSRPDDVFGPGVGEIVARGIERTEELPGGEDVFGNGPDDRYVYAPMGSFASLVAHVSFEKEWRMCREATRRRLGPGHDAVRERFEQRQALQAEFWTGEMRKLLDHDEFDDADLSPREARMLGELREGAREMLEMFERRDEDD